MRLALVIVAIVSAACEGDLDAAWELDHDRIVAVRATPPAIQSGERSVLDALLAFDGRGTVEQGPEVVVVLSPISLAGALVNDAGAWFVEAPSEPMLAMARMELQVPPGAEVPLQLSIRHGSLEALKTVRLGATDANPALNGMTIDGEPLDMMDELVVSRLADVQLSIAAVPEDDINWLTNLGDIHDYDLPAGYLRVEADEDREAGELALVKRDARGGVVWRVWPIRVE